MLNRVKKGLLLLAAVLMFLAGMFVERWQVASLPQEHTVILDTSGFEKVQERYGEDAKHLRATIDRLEHLADGIETQFLLRDGAWTFRFHQLIDSPVPAVEFLLNLFENALSHDEHVIPDLLFILDSVSDGAAKALGGPDIWELYQRLLQKTSVASLRSAYEQKRSDVLHIAKEHPDLLLELKPMAEGPVNHGVAAEVVERISAWYCFDVIEINSAEWANCQTELLRFKEVWRLPEEPTENQVTFAALLVNQEREGGASLRELLLYVLRDVVRNE